jgi:acetyl-CoA/propionyl-CoA carboxylase biotin carboxyl carrier protein
LYPRPPARGPTTAAAPVKAGGSKRAARKSGGGAASGDSLTSPMQGTIVKVVAEDGQQVAAGDPVVVLEAMKMEQPLTAHKAGTVKGLTASVGEVVTSGAVICELVD